MQYFGTRLKKLRRNASLSQTDMSESIGVSVQTVSKWENGRGMPDIHQIVPLATVLGVSTDYLLGVGYNEDASLEELLKDADDLKKKYGKDSFKYLKECVPKLLELYESFLHKYPMNFTALYDCACYIWYYLSHAKFGNFRLPEDEFDELFRQGKSMLEAIVKRDHDPGMIINAKRKLIDYHILKDDFREAERTALTLPDAGGIRDYGLLAVYENEHANRKAMDLAESAAKDMNARFLNALWERARRTTAFFGSSNAALEIKLWRRLLDEAKEYYADFYKEYDREHKEMYWVSSALEHLCTVHLSNNDIPSALDCVEELAELAVSTWERAKKSEKDPAELESLKTLLLLYLPFCYSNTLYVAESNDNILTREPRFKEAWKKLSEAVEYDGTYYTGFISQNMEVII